MARRSDRRAGQFRRGAPEGLYGRGIHRQSYASFTPEDEALELLERRLDVAARVGCYETEGWRIRRDGTRFWALAVVDAVRDHDGALIGFRLVISQKVALSPKAR